MNKWTIGNSSTEILNVDFIGTDLFLIIKRSDGTYLEKIDCAPASVDTGATYLTHLDRKINNTEVVSETFNAGTGNTTIV